MSTTFGAAAADSVMAATAQKLAHVPKFMLYPMLKTSDLL